MGIIIYEVFDKFNVTAFKNNDVTKFHIGVESNKAILKYMCAYSNKNNVYLIFNDDFLNKFFKYCISNKIKIIYEDCILQNNSYVCVVLNINNTKIYLKNSGLFINISIQAIYSIYKLNFLHIDYYTENTDNIYTIFEGRIKTLSKFVNDLNYKLCEIDIFWLYKNSITQIAIGYIMNKYKDISYFIDADVYNLAKDFYFGGRCKLNKKHATDIIYIDYKSMHTNILLEKFPTGKFTILDSRLDINVVGFHYIEFSSNLEETILQVRLNNKTVYNNGTFSGLYWYEEIMLFVESGGIVLNIKFSIISSEYTKIFSDFATFCLNKRNLDCINKILYKIIPNNIIGWFASENSNDKYKNILYSIIVSSRGRIKWYNTIRSLKKSGFELIYSDTDSFFVKGDIKNLEIDLSLFNIDNIAEINISCKKKYIITKSDGTTKNVGLLRNITSNTIKNLIINDYSLSKDIILAPLINIKLEYNFLNTYILKNFSIVYIYYIIKYILKYIIIWFPDKIYIKKILILKYSKYIINTNNSDNAEWRRIHNIFVILELFDLFDFRSNFNYTEDIFYKFKKMTYIDKVIYIIENAAKFLENNFNEYTYNYILLFYSNVPNQTISLSAIKFNVDVCSNFIKYIIRTGKGGGRKKNYNYVQEHKLNIPEELIKYDEVYENIIYNIGVAIIHRCKFIIITNNACKNNIKLIPFTNGNTIFIHHAYMQILKKLYITKKLILNKPKILTVLENKNVYNLIDNNNFSYRLWIEKQKNYVQLNQNKYTRFINEKYDMTKFLDIINSLNNTEIEINVDYYYSIINSIETSNLYKSVELLKQTEFKSNLDVQKIKIDTDIDINDSFILKRDKLDYLEYSTIKKNVVEILTKFNNKFYFSYVLDRRTRVYVYQWPFNYQLNKFVRNIINIKNNFEIVSIYIKFFNTEFFIKYKKLGFKFWKIQTLFTDKIHIFLKKWNIDINIYQLNYYEFTEVNLSKLIFLDILLIILVSIAPKTIVKHIDKLNHSLSNFDKIYSEMNNDIKYYFLTEIMAKNDIENLVKLYNINNVLNNNLRFTVWADASSSAMQLLTIVSGTKNIELLKILNIINNDTQYRNIYEYVLNKLILADGVNDIHLNIIKGIIDIEIVKSIVMPMAYGKTKWSCFKTTDAYLIKNSNQIWSKLIDSDKKFIVEIIFNKACLILNNLGLNIQDHITLCKKKYKDNNIIYNPYNIPIITNTYKILDRISIINKIRRLENSLAPYINLYKEQNKCADNRRMIINKACTFIEENLSKKNNKYLSSNFNIEHSIWNTNKKIKKYKNILLEDDNFTRRINVKIKNTRYQFRVQRIDVKKTNDKKNMTAITPNLIHSIDAAILFLTIEKLNKLGINCLCIHDSIGTDSRFINIAMFLYKQSIIETILQFKKTMFYPYDNSTVEYSIPLTEDLIEVLESSGCFFI